MSLAVGDPYRAAIDQMFAQAQIERATLLETTSAVAVCAMVRQGLGMAIVNPLTALALSGPDLLVRPLDMAIAYRVGLLLPQMAAPQPALAQLVDAIHQAAKGITASLSL